MKSERPQAADFRTDDDVVFPHTFQQLAQAALVYLFGAADGLADPFVHLQVVFPTESFDFVALVLDRLAVGTDANISIYHFCAKVQNPLTRHVSRLCLVSFCPIPSAHIFASKK